MPTEATVEETAVVVRPRKKPMARPSHTADSVLAATAIPTPHGTSGYGSIYYANANGVSYSQHNNRYYVIAVTPLSGGGGGGM